MKKMRRREPIEATVGAGALMLLLSACSGPPATSGGLAVPHPPASYQESAPDSGFELKSATIGGQTHYYRLRAPLSYNGDKTQAYPLVIYLHPWGVDNDPAKQPGLRVDLPEPLAQLPTSVEHAAFVYAPVCPPPYFSKNEPSAPQGGEWNSPAAKAMVITTILELQSRFHIDPQRIYLVGFSMGGSGSWYMAAEYHRQTGSHFAAVVRGSGWYLDKDPNRKSLHEAVSLSPTWIHVGDKDDQGLRVANENFRYYQDEFASAPDTVQVRTLEGGLVAESHTLPLRSGSELRYSIYRGVGHENLVFRDSETLNWMFAQHLKGGLVDLTESVRYDERQRKTL